MAEKFRYGPLVYNCFGEEDDSGNYWWPGNPPVAYEQPEGVRFLLTHKVINVCQESVFSSLLSRKDRLLVVLDKIPSLDWYWSGLRKILVIQIIRCVDIFFVGVGIIIDTKISGKSFDQANCGR